MILGMGAKTEVFVMSYYVKFTRLLLSISLVLFCTKAPLAQGFEVNIMTGGPSGTYIQIGKDIAALAASTDWKINAVESQGSMENIEAVRERLYTQFGIVQSDVLDFIRTFRSEDAAMRRIVRSTRIAFPLYNEEVHIVTTKSSGISELVDLSGRIVGVGAPNSGTNLTSTFLFEIAYVRPEQSVSISATEALAQLKAGTIDAFIYVAGAPTNLLLNTSPTDDLKLISTRSGSINEYYGTSTIKAGTYPWQTQDITTPAVRAVLMTYEYNPARNAYLKMSCDAVSEISYLINANIETLKQNGHPKWNQVDLNAIPPGWERARCVQKALEESYKPPHSHNKAKPRSCADILNPVALRLCRMQSAAQG